MHDNTRQRQRYEDWLKEVKSPDDDRIFRRAEHLWNEYQHRHNLVWNLVFRLTTAVVALAVIPYTQDEVTQKLKWWILAPPILGVVLGLFGFLRLWRELRHLDRIRYLYRLTQDKLFFGSPRGKSKFTMFVLLYIVFLIALAVINVLLIAFCWIPASFNKPTSWVCLT